MSELPTAIPCKCGMPPVLERRFSTDDVRVYCPRCQGASVSIRYGHGSQHFEAMIPLAGNCVAQHVVAGAAWNYMISKIKSTPPPTMEQIGAAFINERVTLRPIGSLTAADSMGPRPLWIEDRNDATPGETRRIGRKAGTFPVRSSLIL